MKFAKLETAHPVGIFLWVQILTMGFVLDVINGSVGNRKYWIPATLIIRESFVNLRACVVSEILRDLGGYVPN